MNLNFLPGWGSMSKSFKYRAWIGLGASMLLLSIISGHAFPQGKAPASRPIMGYDSIKKELQLFETILNKKLELQFPVHRLVIVDRPKGVYLKGYGVVFTFLINVNRASFKTPFGEHKLGEIETPEQKKRRIRELKEMLVKTLSDYAGAMDQLNASDNVVIVAYFEDNNELDELKKNKTVVISVLKRELNEYKVKANYQEFRKKVNILEY